MSKARGGSPAMIESDLAPGDLGLSPAFDWSGFDTRVGGNWNKPVYNLAVICIEYPDQKHNPKITSQAWEDSLFSTGTYTETSVTGAGPGVLGLSYASRRVSSLPTFLGSKFDARFDLGNGMIWMPFGSLAWVHEFLPNRDVTASLISMPVPAFTVEGARAASDSARIELGSRLVLNRWSELSARFSGEFSSAGQSYTGMGSLRVNW